MNSPQETQLATELRQIVADPPFPPDLAAIERRGYQRRRRAYAVRGLAGLTGLTGLTGLALAGGLIVSAHAGHVGPVAGRAPSAAPAGPAPVGPARAETVAYVRRQIAAALSPGNFLVETRQNTSSTDRPPGMITIWTDPRTGNTMLLQGAGSSRVTYWEHDYYDSHRVLHWDQTQVNYGPRTWWTYDEHAAGSIQGPVPPGPAGGNYATPQAIEQLLEHDAAIVGHPYVDGHRTVELAVSLGAGGKFEIWADAHTYQVVRSARYFPAGLHARPIVASYSWVPRSAALASLINTPRVPAGFTQVPADSRTS